MISVICSTYNRSDHFLPKAIDSVLKQTYKDWELIIVDDCSTDDTEYVVANYKDVRIKYIKLEENFGSDTRPKNTGIEAAKYEFICFIDDDVQYRPNHLQTLIESFTDDLDVVYSDMMIMPEHEKGIAHDFDAQFLMLRNFIDTSAAMVRRSALYDVGGWDETLKKFVDWNLWVRMTKAGKKFKRVPVVTFSYWIHEDTKSQRVKTQTYSHPTLGTLYVPTFDPAGCYINVGCIGEVYEPSVAIFTIHYNRPDYSRQTWEEMTATAGYPFEWYCYNNGGTEPFGDGQWIGDGINVGITKSSNALIRKIKESASYDIIIKIDNDVEFQTKDWLTDVVDLWKRNHMIYVSPYVEGLYHHPGGAQRRGYGMIGDEFIEVTNHIGGIFAAISAKAYDSFRWQDEMLHGDQDSEASYRFREMGYMPCYYPKHRIMHRDGTLGQMDKDEKYHKKRKIEKVTKG